MTDAGRLATYDGVEVATLVAAAGVPSLEVHAALTSTLDRVHLLAASEASAGTAVVAEWQSAGRGQHGRAWHSEAGAGVWLSVLERPVDSSGVGVLSLRLGLLLANALAPYSRRPIRLKWPNDLWTDAGKLAGILVEARWRGGTLEWVAVGVGVNVAVRAADPAAIGLDDGVTRAEVLVATARAIRAAAAETGLLSEAELSAWGARDLARGRAITEPVVGSVRGLRADGSLMVQGSGGIQTVMTGSLRFAI